MSARPPLLRLLQHAGQHRGAVMLGTTFSVLNKIFDLAPPVLIGMAVDTVVQRESSWLAMAGVVDVHQQLIVLAVLTVLIWGLESLFEYLFQWIWRNLAQTLQHELRVQAYGHVQRLELAWFQDRSTGRLLSILNDDVNQLERFLDGGANDLLQVGTTVVVISAAFFWISPGVAALSVLPIPFILWGSFRFQSRIAPRYASVRELASKVSGQLANNLTGIETIKSFTAEAREVERVRAQSQAYREANAHAIRLSAAFSPLIRMVIVVGFTATLLYGGWLTLDGKMDVGAYSVLVFMTQRLLWPLTRLGATFDLYQRAMASTARLLDLLDTPIGIVDGSQRLPVASVKGAIDFDAVTFAYPEREPVLVDFDLHIEPGQTVAVVGPTGAGKSTLIRALLRLHDVQAGRVCLDGHPVSSLALGDLRGAVGLVSQSVYLFPGTVAENIAYGRPDAPREAIVAAARAAGAHEFVVDLPNGYDTVVGERGQKLSGGQRQRLSIARAILKDPPILVLDEATSAVDNETEAAIQASLREVGAGRTVLVIAHRLSTIRHADRIVVLDRGVIVQSGTHDELVLAEGLYRRLWNVQTGELRG